MKIPAISPPSGSLPRSLQERRGNFPSSGLLSRKRGGGGGGSSSPSLLPFCLPPTRILRTLCSCEWETCFALFSRAVARCRYSFDGILHLKISSARVRDHLTLVSELWGFLIGISNQLISVNEMSFQFYINLEQTFHYLVLFRWDVEKDFPSPDWTSSWVGI